MGIRVSSSLPSSLRKEGPESVVQSPFAGGLPHTSTAQRRQGLAAQRSRSHRQAPRTRRLGTAQARATNNQAGAPGCGQRGRALPHLSQRTGPGPHSAFQSEYRGDDTEASRPPHGVHSSAAGSARNALVCTAPRNPLRKTVRGVKNCPNFMVLCPVAPATRRLIVLDGPRHWAVVSKCETLSSPL